VFVILVCILVIGTTIWHTWKARHVELLQAQTAMDNMARSLAQQAGDTIKAADVSLAGLTQQFEAKPISQRDLYDLHARAVRIVAELPQVLNLIIVDANGLTLVNSTAQTASATEATSYGDRAYFAYHRDTPDLGAYIGPPIRSRSKAGAWAITVSRRINNPDGSFAGVAAASVAMSYFQTFYDTYKIGSQGAITLYTNGGVLLARRPFIEASMGQSSRNGPLFQQHLPKAPFGFFQGVSLIDGLERFASYRQLTRYPLVIAVSRTTDEVLADWWADAKRAMAVVVALTSGFGIAGFYLIQQIKRRTQTEADLVAARDALAVANQHLQGLASTDALTGLANRRHFDMLIDAEFRRARREGTPLALILIDVDQFKKYNDLYGHPAGDQCLREIARVLSAHQRRAGDLAARYGGEEFVMLLPGTDAAGAGVVAEMICTAIRDQQISHAGSPMGIVTISAGTSAMDPRQEDSSMSLLIQAADQALYKAKEAGRDRVCCQGGVAAGMVA
jgi:diguanylate cyclase (GGDEF)-like protein